MILPGRFEWIDTDGRFQLAIMPRPSGGSALDASIGELKALGVDVLASLLTEEETQWMELEEEGEVCARHGIEFLNFPIPDHSVPESVEDAVAFASELERRLLEGKRVVTHCFAGIGRSSLMAIATMILAGFEVEDACGRASAARGLRVPETRAQRAWLDAIEPSSG